MITRETFDEIREELLGLRQSFDLLLFAAHDAASPSPSFTWEGNALAIGDATAEILITVHHLEDQIQKLETDLRLEARTAEAAQ